MAVAASLSAGEGGQQRRRRRGIYAVLLWLVVASLLPGMVGATVLFVREYLHGRAQLEASTIATARALAQAVDSQLFQAVAIGDALATAKSLQSDDLATFHEHARKLIDVSKAVDVVVLSDATGQQLINTLRGSGVPLPQHANPDVNQRVFATGRPVISDIYIGGVLRKPVMSVDLPVVVGGKVKYNLSIGLMLGRFNDMLEKQGLPDGWIIGVFDSTGTLAGRIPSPEKFVGQKGTAEFIQRIKESPEGAMETYSRENIPTLSSWSRSAMTGWSVGIGIPRAQLEEGLRKSLLLLAAGMATLMAIGVALAWMTAKRIGDAIRGLRAPALALVTGVREPLPELDIREPAEVLDAIGHASELLSDNTSALEVAYESLLAKEAELQEAHHRARFGVWRWYRETGKMLVSDSVREIFGRDVPSFPEQRDSLLPVESWERLWAVMQGVVRTGEQADVELQACHGGGAMIWLDFRCDAGRRVDGEIVEVTGSVLDITQRKEAELKLEAARRRYRQELEQQVADRTAELKAANETLERLARIDALTGLPNRRVAEERLRFEFLRLKRTRSPYAVLFLDIDRFKEINDTYGHETGDRVLRRLGTILAESIRETDLVARFGGEEFLALLVDTEVEAATMIAEKIRETVARDAILPDGRHFTVSIGISMARDSDAHGDVAVRRADDALYEAKGTGRNRVCVIG